MTKRKIQVDATPGKFTIAGFEYEAVMYGGAIVDIEEKFDISVEDMLMEIVTRRMIGKFFVLLDAICEIQNEDYVPKDARKLHLKTVVDIAVMLSKDLQQIMNDDTEEVKKVVEVMNTVVGKSA